MEQLQIRDNPLESRAVPLTRERLVQLYRNRASR